MIQRIVMVVALIGILSTASMAQSNQQVAVAAAVESFRKALIGVDKKGLEDVTADSLSYGHSGGKVENKAAFIEGAINGNLRFLTIEITDQTISIFGNTAIVRHRLTGTTVDKSKVAGTVNIHVLSVWQKYKQGWKMLARQAVKLP